MALRVHTPRHIFSWEPCEKPPHSTENNSDMDISHDPHRNHNEASDSNPARMETRGPNAETNGRFSNICISTPISG
ncbi:hypothetical protein K504DRAFT_11721 [Pleomassaria siparia CBS 279.74]|uniref:Uncharacterized protein n=1 Tax=Pleomassaria siparia CBS 279.74 TaxID=1314801 RepID=A0A6G1KQJ1_9PLEO|nr:hypothetical protein K504DRAFT_11721 [Pleomassaria siparia CBS 279.74]